jgi:hypothetical protein
MTADHFEETIIALLDRVPFELFTVELNTGKRIEIDHSRAALVRNGKAVFVGPGGTPHWFDHESVTQIIEAPANADE